jgi:hypothetical protein
MPVAECGEIDPATRHAVATPQTLIVIGFGQVCGDVAAFSRPCEEKINDKASETQADVAAEEPVPLPPRRPPIVWPKGICWADVANYRNPAQAELAERKGLWI